MQTTINETGFNEVKRVERFDDCGKVVTRLFSLGGVWFVEQVDTYWNRIEKDSAATLAEAETMFAAWVR